MRPHATYANVTATLALVAALGGGAYAAATLPKDSVGAAQLKKDAVTSKAVKDRSLLARDFKAGQLPAGPRGPQGPAGTAGEVWIEEVGNQVLTDGEPFLTHQFLESGEFAVEAVVSASTSATGPVALQCTVGSSSQYGTTSGLMTLGTVAGATRSGTLTVLADLHSVVGRDEATVQCGVEGTGTVTVTSARMHVTRVASFG